MYTLEELELKNESRSGREAVDKMKFGACCVFPPAEGLWRGREGLGRERILVVLVGGKLVTPVSWRRRERPRLGARREAFSRPGHLEGGLQSGSARPRAGEGAAGVLRRMAGCSRQQQRALLQLSSDMTHSSQTRQRPSRRRRTDARERKRSLGLSFRRVEEADTDIENALGLRRRAAPRRERSRRRGAAEAMREGCAAAARRRATGVAVKYTYRSGAHRNRWDVCVYGMTVGVEVRSERSFNG